MGRVFDLLIVDDDPAQLQLAQSLLAELGLPHRCHHASDGPKAIDFLQRKHPFEEAPRPHLILMDLNMPGMDGCEVLRRVKSDAQLCAIPVIMFSSSQALQDVNAAYCGRANAYICKPTELEANLTLFRDIVRFWAEVAVLPGDTAAFARTVGGAK